MTDHEFDIHELTFDEVVDRIREPLAELEAVEHELEPAVRTFVRNVRAALDHYDRRDTEHAS